MTKLFFKNYSTPGKGVNKRDPNQPRYQIFVDILPRNMWRLVKLSVLYLSFALPFFIVTMLAMGTVSSQIINFLATRIPESVTSESLIKYDLLIKIVLSFWFTMFLGQGPITAGLTYIVREYGNERHCWLISDFFSKVKSNFKQGIVLWLIDLFVACGGFIAIIFYMKANMYIFVAILFFVINTYFLAHIYIYQIMITYDLKLKDIFRNSILIALGKLPLSLLIMISLVFIYVGLPWVTVLYGQSILFLIMLAMEVFVFPALSAFTVNFCIYPILKSCMENNRDNNE